MKTKNLVVKSLFAILIISTVTYGQLNSFADLTGSDFAGPEYLA